MTLLTRREAAARLRVSLSTLDRLSREGRIRPVHPTPGRTLYLQTELDNFIASLRTKVA